MSASVISKLPVTQDDAQTLLGLSCPADLRKNEWHYVNVMLLGIQRDVQEGKRRFLKATIGWVNAYEMIRAFEETVVSDPEPMSPSERQHFIGNISILKGLGRHLINVIEKHDLSIPEEAGISLSDILAICEELSAMEQAYSAAPIPPKKQNLLESLFRVPGPSTNR